MAAREDWAQCGVVAEKSRAWPGCCSSERCLSMVSASGLRLWSKRQQKLRPLSPGSSRKQMGHWKILCLARIFLVVCLLARFPLNHSLSLSTDQCPCELSPCGLAPVSTVSILGLRDHYPLRSQRELPLPPGSEPAQFTEGRSGSPKMMKMKAVMEEALFS